MQSASSSSIATSSDDYDDPLVATDPLKNTTAGAASGTDAPPDRDDLDAETSTCQYEAVESFDDMNLPRELLRGIYAAGFDAPSQIQKRAIIPCSQSNDVIAQAPSGTGKTATFVIAALARMATIDAKIKELNLVITKRTRVIVLSPTRELAVQTHECATKIGRWMPVETSSSECFVGGTSVREDIEKAKASPALAIGTPGRILDLVKRGVLRVGDLETLVLDEADEILSRGFIDSIKELLQMISKNAQIVLFSATIPAEIVTFADSIMRSPSTKILIKREMVNLLGLCQTYIRVEEEYKLETLCDLYRRATISQSVVFCSDRRKVDWVAGQMEKAGHAVSRIHGELESAERKAIFDSFRTGQTRVLISTDLFGRGIDVQSVSVIINYDIPQDPSQYVHRVGRAARYGRRGLSINFVSTKDQYHQEEIEKYYKIAIKEFELTDFNTLTGSG